MRVVRCGQYYAGKHEHISLECKVRNAPASFSFTRASKGHKQKRSLRGRLPPLPCSDNITLLSSLTYIYTLITLKFWPLCRAFFFNKQKNPKTKHWFLLFKFCSILLYCLHHKIYTNDLIICNNIANILAFSPQCNWIIDMLYVLKTEAKPVGVVGGSPWQRAPVWSKLCWRLATDRYENDGCWLIWRIASTFLDDLSALCTESRTNLSF